MATGDLPQSNSVASLVTLIDSLGGKKSTSTTSSNISKEGVDALIKQILESNSGLAEISSGSKRAGSYNSTTQQMLTNDLIARTAGEVEKLRAGTTTTNKTAGAASSPLGKLMAGYALFKNFGGSKLGKGLGKSRLVQEAGADAAGVMDYISGQSSVAPTALISANRSADPLGALAASQSWTTAGTSTAGLVGVANAVDAAGNIIPASQVAGALERANATADPLGSFIDQLGYVDTAENVSTVSDAATAASATEAGGSLLGQGSTLGYIGSALDAYVASQTDKDYRKAVGSAVLNAFGYGWATPIVDAAARPVSDALIQTGNEANGIAGSFMADPVGTVLSGQYEFGDVLNAVSDPLNLFGGNDGGSVGGFIESLATPVTGAIEGIGDAIEDSVICTELNRQGRLEYELYKASSEKALTLPKEIIRGYHYWAKPFTRFLRKSTFTSALIAPIVKSRCEYLLGKKRVWGWLTVVIGQPICAFIGRRVNAD